MHAYCHNIGDQDMPWPPGAKIPKFMRDLQVFCSRLVQVGVTLGDERSVLATFDLFLLVGN